MTPAVDWDHLLLAEPHWLWLLLLVFGLFVMRIRSRKHIAPLRIPSLINFRIAEPKRAWAGRFLPSTLRALALSSLVVALARPQLSESTQSIKSSGVDIVMAVDLSASMLALDMSEREDKPVTRLDVVKSVMKDFVTKRTHDRIGLVGFSVNPYLLSALTLDKEHLHRNLKRLRVGLTHQIGTNIGGALTEGINRVRQLEAESRIVILLTDGKDDPPPRHSPLVLAEGAKTDGIKIYTIAVGRDTRTYSYVYDQSTRDVQRGSDDKPIRRLMDYPVDKEILKEIADVTGAKFFEAGTETDLRNIYDEIDQLEKTETEYDLEALYDELFHWPLMVGLIILLFEIVLARTLLLSIP